MTIFHTLKRGKEVIERQMEKPLLKSVLGYKYDETVRGPVEVDLEVGSNNERL
ncbi:hypothetical protein QRE66_09285 [Bacillus cereus]|nr:hypothetical protein QRE66_09285 [Bacillus cereus]